MRRLRRRDPAPDTINLTMVQVATVMGVCRSIVYRMIRDGQLKTFKIGARRFASRAEVERLAAEFADQRAA